MFVAAAVAPGTVPVPAGLSVVRGGCGRRLRSVLPASLLGLVRRARRADALVAGTEVGFALLLAAFAARLTRRPLAVTVQSEVGQAVENYVPNRLRGLTRAALRSADLAVCVARGLVEPTAGFARRVVAVPNAVARDELIAAARDDPTVAWPDDLPLVVGVGRLVRQKGFDLLIRAHARALADGGPRHRLAIIGDGEDGDSLRQLADELGVGDTVTLPGFVANPHAVVARAAVFALSSRWEGFSLCLAEALAVGTPCVAFDCVAGPSEVLDGGRYGRLLPAGDVDALADAVRVHLSDPADLLGRVRLAADEDLPIFDPAAAAGRHRDELRQLTSRGD